MKLLSLALSALLALTQTALAAPVDTVATSDVAPTSNDNAKSANGFAPAAANNGIPQCHEQFRDLCLADNVKAYCGPTGFENELGPICHGLCWCT